MHHILLHIDTHFVHCAFQNYILCYFNELLNITAPMYLIVVNVNPWQI
jgi:hypothetical protein